jgi:hypothetical protein
VQDLQRCIPCSAWYDNPLAVVHGKAVDDGEVVPFRSESGCRVAVGDGLGADVVADGLDDPLVVLFFFCLAYNVVYSLRRIYCEAEDAVPVGCAAEAVCDVVCLPRLPLDVEVVDGEVLPPLLASCIANLVNLLRPDTEERSVIRLDRELLHTEMVVPALLDRVLDR